MKAKIQFLRIGDTTVYRVLEQDKAACESGTIVGIYVDLSSVSHSDIKVYNNGIHDVVSIYLRGNGDTLDEQTSVVKIQKDLFDNMLRELNEKCPDISVDVDYIHPGDIVVMNSLNKVRLLYLRDGEYFYGDNYMRNSVDKIKGVCSSAESETPLFSALVADNGLKWRRVCRIGNIYVDYDSAKHIEPKDIISAVDIDYCKFVRCEACGEIFRKTKSEIRKHLSKGSSLKSCLTCSLCAESYGEPVSEKISVVNGVRYRVTKSVCTYKCKRSHGQLDFDDASYPKTFCKYNLCAEEKLKPLELPVKTPSTLLTIEALRTVHRGKQIADFDTAVKIEDGHKLGIKITGEDSLSAVIVDGVVARWSYKYRRRTCEVRFNNDTKEFFDNNNRPTDVPRKIGSKIERIYRIAEDENKKGKETK